MGLVVRATVAAAVLAVLAALWRRLRGPDDARHARSHPHAGAAAHPLDQSDAVHGRGLR